MRFSWLHAAHRVAAAVARAALNSVTKAGC